MADIYTTPATASTGGNIGAAFWNTNGRDNTEALFAGLTGDTSADSDVKHAHKTGVFSARPAATKAGQLYYASDYDAQYHATGSVWKHLTGRGLFDDFERANSTAIGSANSGHPWTEYAGTHGDLEISGNALRAVSLTSGIALGTLDSGGVIETGQWIATVVTGGTVANINVGLVLKYLNSTTFLWVQLHGSLGFRLLTGPTSTVLTSHAYAPGAGTQHTMVIDARGSYISGALYLASAMVSRWEYAKVSDVVTPFTAATKTGCLYGTAAHDTVAAFSFKPN